MEKRRGEPDLSITVGPETLKVKEESLTEACGGQPSQFILELLADPKDEKGELKLATELLVDGVVGLPFLNEIENPDIQSKIKVLAARYRATLEMTAHNNKAAPEKRAEQKKIKREFQEIIDEELAA